MDYVMLAIVVVLILLLVYFIYRAQYETKIVHSLRSKLDKDYKLLHPKHDPSHVFPAQPVAPQYPVIPAQPVAPQYPVIPAQPVAPQYPVIPAQPVQPYQDYAKHHPAAQQMRPTQHFAAHKQPYAAHKQPFAAAPAPGIVGGGTGRWTGAEQELWQKEGPTNFNSNYNDTDADHNVPDIDYNTQVTDLVADDRMREGQEKWYKEMKPWSAVAMTVDNLDEAMEASTNFIGLRRPQPVLQSNDDSDWQRTERDTSTFINNPKFIFTS